METKHERCVSEGSSLIIEEAMKDDPRPLYVLFLGPLTDLAAAYLQEPRIANRLTAIWIGGGGLIPQVVLSSISEMISMLRT